MNPVGELLRVEDIALDVDVSTSTVLERLAPMLVRRSWPTQAEVLECLMEREALGSTAMGHGVAIPHARMARCEAEAAALIRTRGGIPFNAPDGKPVSLFLGLIVPKQANKQHLKLLATAAAMFSDRGFRTALRASPDAASAMKLLAAWSETSASGG
jgi:PTS system nitrogen regulatory IIA component